MRRHDRTAPKGVFEAVLAGLKHLFGGKAVTPYRPAGVVDPAYVRAEWDNIVEAMMSGGESRFQQAVIAADKLLDYVLRARVPGETMGERLKRAQSLFSSREAYQAAWEGHKLRNRLVHEVDYATVSWEAKEAIKNFERALRDLGAL